MRQLLRPLLGVRHAVLPQLIRLLLALLALPGTRALSDLRPSGGGLDALRLTLGLLIFILGL